MTDTAEQAGSGIAASAMRSASDKRTSRIGGYTRATLLYGLGGSFIVTGMALIGKEPGAGLGFLCAAALVTPVARRMAYRVTGISLPNTFRIVLVLTLPVLPSVVQSVQVTVAEQQTERQKLAAELAAQKPTLMKRLQASIDRGVYPTVVTEAKRFDLIHDPDLKALGAQAQRLLDAQQVEREAIARSAEQARCNADDACFSKAYTNEARRQCKPMIEASARFDHEWTDGFGDPQTFFSSYVDRDVGTIRFAGNQLKLQNGFGAWRQYRYECLFDYRRNKVVTAEVNG